MQLTLLACGGSPTAPVVERRQPPSQQIAHHVVSRGETLYSIAWTHNQDWHYLAARNGIRAPYLIKAGQTLQLTGKVPTPPRTSPKRVSPPPARKATGTARVSKAATTAVTAWQWPATGKVVKGFAAGAKPPHKGIDLAGRSGDPVLAANNGVVVYAGSGIRGYGNLLIVKHNDTYLSAYAHNRRMLVGEGATVRAGERIAEVGDSGTDRVKLHFELRRQGKPIDPVSLLPAR